MGALGTGGRSRLQRCGQNRFGDGQWRGSLWSDSRTGIGGHDGGWLGWGVVVGLNGASGNGASGNGASGLVLDESLQTARSRRTASHRRDHVDEPTGHRAKGARA